MTRLPDWADRLNQLVAARREAPFVWGKHDCSMWAADCVLAVEGRDIGAPFRGKYSTAFGAARALRRYGSVSTPVEVVDRELGERLPMHRALLGCVVAASPDDVRLYGGFGHALGLCYGRTSLFVGSDGARDGLVMVPTLSLEHCYRA